MGFNTIKGDSSLDKVFTAIVNQIHVDGTNTKVMPAGTPPSVVYRIGDGTEHDEGWDNVDGEEYLDFYLSNAVIENPEEVLIVGENIDDVIIVADDIASVITTATNIDDILTIIANMTNINIVAANDANITIVATANSNITTLAGINADITTVAGISADVTIVAGISADVTAVSAIDSDVTIVATNVDDITNFADVYQGGKASDPATRNDSSALQTGDMYFNTTDDEMKVYTSISTWIGTVTPSTFIPTLTGNATGTETTILVVTITNWNSDQTLTISVEAGSYVDNDDGTISWTLPEYTGVDDSHDMSIQATEPSHIISATTTHTVAVLEAISETDQTILFENATMTATEFPTRTNIDISGSTLLANADTASATSYKVEQGGGDNDFINATPTVDNTASNYTISAGATTSSVTITGATTFVTGDILLMNKTATTALTEIDTTSITTDNGGDSYTFDISGLSFTNAPLVVAKDTALVTTSLVDTGLSDDFEARTIVSHTADNVGGINPPDDISGASYDSDSYDPTTQDAAPKAFRFNPDGTKMYTIGNTTDSIYQYSLSTAFDLSTASYDTVTLNVSGQDNTPFGFRFSPDGTKMYVAGYNNDIVYQYTLSSAWDLSTASYASISYGATETTNTASLLFNNDGTKMYLCERPSRVVYQYTLSTPYNVSTASYDSKSASLASEESTSLEDIAFNNDGTKLLAVGVNSAKVFQYSLSTAFDISTASYDSVSYDVSSQDTAPNSLEFSNGGTKMYMMGSTTDVVYKYSVNGTINTIDNAPTLITDVFDTDARIGRDFKVDVDLADDEDEVTRISIPIEKLV